MSELKACPFCGEKPEKDKWGSFWRIGCVTCDFTLEARNADCVDEMWNARRSDDAGRLRDNLDWEVEHRKCVYTGPGKGRGNTGGWAHTDRCLSAYSGRPLPAALSPEKKDAPSAEPCRHDREKYWSEPGSVELCAKCHVPVPAKEDEKR